jgi:hypothetical protein
VSEESFNSDPLPPSDSSAANECLYRVELPPESWIERLILLALVAIGMTFVMVVIAIAAIEFLQRPPPDQDRESAIALALLFMLLLPLELWMLFRLRRLWIFGRLPAAIVVDSAQVIISNLIEFGPDARTVPRSLVVSIKVLQYGLTPTMTYLCELRLDRMDGVPIRIRFTEPFVGFARMLDEDLHRALNLAGNLRIRGFEPIFPDAKSPANGPDDTRGI